MYLACPRCYLIVRVQSSTLTLERCPRCLARTATSVPLLERETRTQALAEIDRLRKRRLDAVEVAQSMLGPTQTA